MMFQFDLFADCTPIVVEPAPEVNLEFDQSGPRLMISHIVNEKFQILCWNTDAWAIP